MKKFRLLSFLCLLVIGWSSAWADAVTFSFGSTPQSWTADSRSDRTTNVISVSPITMTLNSGTEGKVTPYDANLTKMKFQKTASCVISCESGYKITGIIYQVDNNSRNFTPSVNSISAYTGSADPFTSTWSAGSGENITSVTFTNGTTNNINVYNFVVTYEALPELIPVYAAWRNNGSGQLSDPNNLTVGSTNRWGFVVRQSSDNSMINFGPNDIVATTDNGTVNIVVGSNYGRYGFLDITPAHCGDINVTLYYKGNETYSESAVITYKFKAPGTEVRIGGIGGNNDSRFIDDATWNHIVTLRPIGAEDNFTISSKDNFNIYSNDTTGVAVFSISDLTNNNTRLPIRITPLSVGKMTVNVDFLGDANYYPCSGSFEIEVKKHKTKLDFSSNAYEVGYESDGTEVTGTPTLTTWMDEDGKASTYNVVYSSSDEHVATVDPNTGAVTMHNSGTTVITAKVVTTKQITSGGETYTVEAYTDEEASYTLTVRGNQNQEGVLVWLSQLNPDTGSPLGGKIRGSYWTQKEIMNYTTEPNGNVTKFNFGSDTPPNQINTVTTMPYGNEIIVQASAFKNMNWLGEDNNGVYKGTWFDAGTDLTVEYSTHFFKLKDDTYFTGNEEGLKHRDTRYNWRYNKIENYQNYIPAASLPTTWSYVQRNGTTKTQNNVWMSNIEYSLSDPRLLDGASEGERIQAGGTEGQCWTKEYSIRPYPAMDADGNVTGDSITIYATIPGNGNVNPITISHKILITKGTYHLSTEPEEGYVTEGEWVIPYVNIPDIKLKDIKKITVWFEDPTVGKIECEVSTNEDGKVIYTLYEKDVTSSEWIHTKYDSDSKLDYVDMIYPKIIGLLANHNTTMHLKVESPYYEDQECTYILHVLEDASHPKFHWYVNDDGTKGNHCIMGRDKGINKPRTILFGEDDGVIKDIEIYEGDIVHMPGIVGTPNGNDEFSVAGNVNDRGQANPSPGYKYLYGIKNGEVERNSNPYYWREGVPNYFFTTGVNEKGNGVFEPQGEPLIPTNHASTNQSALIIKGIAEWGSRGDTLMVYGNKAGVSYLWAQDAQTHLCCTPIRLTVKPRSELLAEKRAYLQGMSYPYTWDFEHMDMSNIEEDYRNNGSTYWELHRDESNNAEYYQADGFFNADYDDKNGDGSYRNRWFKDLTTGKGGYMPQFYGLMLNISGLEYWTQKYNRFNIAVDGSCIYFVGGPHYLQLPGFGINPTGTYGQDETYSYEKFSFNSAHNLGSSQGIVSGKDGTRYNDNYVGKLHNHVNVIDRTFAEGYTHSSNGTNMYNTQMDLKNNDNIYRNKKVRFVIVASGNKNSGSGNSSSQFHIGGKSMIDQALDINEINWNWNTNDPKRKGTDGKNYNKFNHPGYSQYNLSDKKTTYVFELDPYDPEFQDHIYIMFNSDVKVYWMGISTEPRELRSDYDNFSYSYPKDIDMDKTNVLMNIATEKGVTAKDQIDGTADKYNDMQVGTKISFDAYYASKYNVAQEALTVKNITDFRDNYPNRFAGSETNASESEGVIIYPSIQVSEFDEDHQGFKTESYNRTYTKWIEGEYAEKEMTVDGVTIPFVVPVCTTETKVHKFQYLPTYFIANAQNVADYGNKSSVVKANTETVFGKSRTMYRAVQASSDEDYAAKYEGIGVVPLLNGEGGIPKQSAADATHKTNWNNSVNLLRPAPYTTHILMDYNVKGDGTVEAGTNMKGTMHATLTVATSENTTNTTWNRTNYTLTWNNTAGTQVTGLNLPSGDLRGYEKLVVNCASVKEDNPFVVKINFNTGDPEEYVITKTGVSEFDLTELGNNLQNVKSITFGGNTAKKGSAVISDIYVTGPANDNRWINLGMSNEFVWRNLAFTDVKTMMNSLYDQTTNQYNNNTMYELIGPEFVRFYRANAAENMRNRRSYLSLTWNEYNVDTYGKGGVNWNKENEYNGTVIQIPDGVVAQTETNPSSDNGNEEFGQLPFTVSVPGSLRRNPIRIVFNDFDDQTEEGVVSEDGGFPDGIKEIEESANADFNAPFYNLNGLRITNPSKGVYIQNGKKVIVR